MNTTDLIRQHEAIMQDLQRWRARRASLTQRLDAARPSQDELDGRRAVAVAELGPDDQAVGTIRKQLAAGRDELEELEAGLQAADTRILELAAAELEVTARRQALVLVELLTQTAAKADAFARAQATANRELEVFLAAEAECEQWAATLHRAGATPAGPGLSGATLGQVALWRLADRLTADGTGRGPLGLIEPALRRPLREFWREAWRPLREALEAIVRGH